MPPPHSVSSQKTTDIYSVMLIVSMLFLIGAIALTFHELREHYHFWGEETGAATSAE